MASEIFRHRPALRDHPERRSLVACALKDVVLRNRIGWGFVEHRRCELIATAGNGCNVA